MPINQPNDISMVETVYPIESTHNHNMEAQNSAPFVYQHCIEYEAPCTSRQALLQQSINQRSNIGVRLLTDVELIGLLNNIRNICQYEQEELIAYMRKFRATNPNHFQLVCQYVHDIQLLQYLMDGRNEKNQHVNQVITTATAQEQAVGTKRAHNSSIPHTDATAKKQCRVLGHINNYAAENKENLNRLAAAANKINGNTPLDISSNMQRNSMHYRSDFQKSFEHFVAMSANQLPNAPQQMQQSVEHQYQPAISGHMPNKL